MRVRTMVGHLARVLTRAAALGAVYPKGENR